MRNTDDSGKTSCSVRFSACADAKIASERLFDDDARTGCAAGVRQALHDGAEHARRNRQVVQRPLGASECLPQTLVGRGLRVVAFDETQLRGELRECRLIDTAIVLQRLARARRAACRATSRRARCR